MMFTGPGAPLLNLTVDILSYASCFACRALKKEKKAVEKERRLRERELAEKDGQPWPVKRKRSFIITITYKIITYLYVHSSTWCNVMN